MSKVQSGSLKEEWKDIKLVQETHVKRKFQVLQEAYRA